MRAIAKMAWRNVRKNWRHSLAALLSIAAGFVALALFEGYIVDLKDRYTEAFRLNAMFGDLLVEKHGAQDAGREDPWAYALSPSDQAFLDDYLGKSAEVDQRVRFLEMSGMVSNGKTSTIFLGQGYDIAEGAAVRGEGFAWNVLAGKPLDRVVTPGGGDEAAVLGRGLGKVVDCTTQGEVRARDDRGHFIPGERAFTCKKPRLQLSTTTEAGQLNAVDPEVVGITEVGLKELDSRFVLMPLSLAQRLTDSKSVTRYTVKLKDPSHAQAFSAALTSAAAERGLQLDAMSWMDHKVGELFKRGLELMGIFRNFVMLVVLIVAGMSVWNTMAKSVGERVREIGTLRSLGFLRRHVTLLFTTEAAMLAAIAVALGVALTIPLVWGIGVSGIRYKAGILSEAIPLTISYVPSLYVGAAGFLAAVAVFAAFLPARRAARMKIPDALGHV